MIIPKIAYAIGAIFIILPIFVNKSLSFFYLGIGLSILGSTTLYISPKIYNNTLNKKDFLFFTAWYDTDKKYRKKNQKRAAVSEGVISVIMIIIGLCLIFNYFV